MTYMRKFVLVLAIVVGVFAGTGALACQQQCGTHPDGCDYCYENGYDGAEDCYLTNGEWCTLVWPDQCEGYLERWCPGGHCPDDQEARVPPDDRRWQLASVEVIRTKPS